MADTNNTINRVTNLEMDDMMPARMATCRNTKSRMPNNHLLFTYFEWKIDFFSHFLKMMLRIVPTTTLIKLHFSLHNTFQKNGHAMKLNTKVKVATNTK